jgi:hypothetical protein
LLTITTPRVNGIAPGACPREKKNNPKPTLVGNIDTNAPYSSTTSHDSNMHPTTFAAGFPQDGFAGLAPKYFTNM